MWKDYKLGELIEQKKANLQTGPFGTMLNASEYSIAGVPVIAVQDIGDNKLVYHKFVFVNQEVAERLTRYRVKENDIIFGRKGATDRRAIIKKNEEGWLQGSDCIRLRFDDSINAKFISYKLGSKYFKEWMLQFSVGATMPSLNQEILKLLPLRLPSLKYQNTLTEVLSSLDAKIDLLYRQIKTLQELAGTLFRQWFVESRKDGSKEIPLKEIYSFEKGIEPGSRFYLEEPNSNSIRFIRVGDMQDNRATIYIESELTKGKVCTKKDLLVSFDGTVGRVVFGIEGCYSSGMRKVYSENPLYNSLWLKHQIFTTKEIQDEINLHASGTVILHAGSSIEYLTMKFPRESKLKKCHEIINPMYDKIEKNLAQIESLNQLKETLLPKLMSGEVRVEN